MNPLRPALAVCLLAAFTLTTPAEDPPAKRTPKEALRALNDLIGNWRGTGEPSTGTREEKQRNFWTEGISWEWQFKGQDACLKATFDKGKYFTAAELRYRPDDDKYLLKATTAGKETVSFEGTLKDKRLTLERSDDKTNESQRLVINLLHFNRYVYTYEVKAADKAAFGPVYRVGATKEGVAFAGGDDKPECVVSGGLGTIPVSYKGKTYYVCCSGCRDAFRDEPEKYIQEFEARKAKGK
jgi:hypothetical protein